MKPKEKQIIVNLAEDSIRELEVYRKKVIGLQDALEAQRKELARERDINAKLRIDINKADQLRTESAAKVKTLLDTIKILVEYGHKTTVPEVLPSWWYRGCEPMGTLPEGYVVR